MSLAQRTTTQKVSATLLRRSQIVSLWLFHESNTANHLTKTYIPVWAMLNITQSLESMWKMERSFGEEVLAMPLLQSRKLPLSQSEWNVELNWVYANYTFPFYSLGNSGASNFYVSFSCAPGKKLGFPAPLWIAAVHIKEPSIRLTLYSQSCPAPRFLYKKPLGGLSYNPPSLPSARFTHPYLGKGDAARQQSTSFRSYFETKESITSSELYRHDSLLE